jgi:hypothetical protein
MGYLDFEGGVQGDDEGAGEEGKEVIIYIIYDEKGRE